MRSLSLSLPGGWASRYIRGIALYAGIAILGTAFLFFLHFLGNETPHTLIQERIAAEAETDQPISILRQSAYRQEYCYISSLALAGSKHDESYHPLRDAIILRRIHPSWYNWCFDVARDALEDAPEITLVNQGGNTRYWYGAKAIYSISLRWISVIDFHKILRFSIYASYVLLGVSLFFLGIRAFFIGFPIVMTGLFFAANNYFFDTTVGLPHLWTTLSLAILLILFRWERTRRFTSVFCFIIGMISSYFWIFDGHTILAIPAIGMAGWLGYCYIQPRERVRRSLAMIGLYIAGFALCFILNQTAKSIVWEWPDSRFSGYIFRSAIENVEGHLERTASESSAGFTEGNNAAVRSCFGCGRGWQTLPIIRELRVFPALVPGHVRLGHILGFLSGLALVLAISAAIFQAYRGYTHIMWNVSWILVLLLLLCIQFILPDDWPLRSFRMISFALALCWSAFTLVIISLPQQERLITIGCLISGCFIITLGLLVVWESERSRIISIIDNDDPVISGEFNVYYHEKRIIYTADNCDSSLSIPPFLLHIYPDHEINLDSHREEHGFNNRDFSFRPYQSSAMNCTAVVALPDYDIARIRTGQYTSKGHIWAGNFLLSWGTPHQRSLRYAETIESDSPVVSSEWDIFIKEDVIVYHKENCSLRDVIHPFFLHTHPVILTDLPQQRQEHGFENRDFLFTGYDRMNRRVGLGARVGEDCIAVRDLPSYEITSIQTGQYSSEGKTWTVEISPDRE